MIDFWYILVPEKEQIKVISECWLRIWEVCLKMSHLRHKQCKNSPLESRSTLPHRRERSDKHIDSFNEVIFGSCRSILLVFYLLRRNRQISVDLTNLLDLIYSKSEEGKYTKYRILLLKLFCIYFIYITVWDFFSVNTLKKKLCSEQTSFILSCCVLHPCR